MALTEKSVAKLVPGKTRIQLLDDEVTGFGVRVESEADGGRISFFWRAKVNGKQVFRALGEMPSTSIKDARTAALSLAGKAADWKRSEYAGDNPFEKKKRQEPVTVPTFRQLCERYIADHIYSDDEEERANNPEKAEYQVRWFMGQRKLKSGEFIDFSEYVKLNPKATKKTPTLAGWLDRGIDTITVEDVLSVKNACGSRHYLANRIVEFIRAIFNWSSDKTDTKINFWKVQNPAVDVESFHEKPRMVFLKPDELLRFNDALQTETHLDLKDFLTLAITTGARRSDIFSARWQDVEWERSIWQVPFPKNGESYNVQLLPAALDTFNRRRSEIPDSEPYVFPGVGKSGHLTDLKKPWNEFRKRAQLAKFRMHDIRHTHASYAAMAGVSLKTIQAQLGHKSMQSTMVYSHLLDESVRDGRKAGQAKMLSMMKAAKKRGRLAAKPPKKLLSAARS